MSSKEYYLEYYQKNREKLKKASLDWKKNNKERNAKTKRIYVLKNKYGISEEEYSRLHELQNGKCAVCGKELDHNLCVDHDHKTGKIRGLLCDKCNLALGNVDDNLEILLKLIEYLRRVQFPS